jgi:hypothetical protein
MFRMALQRSHSHSQFVVYGYPYTQDDYSRVESYKHRVYVYICVKSFTLSPRELELWSEVQVWYPISIQGQIWPLIDLTGALILPYTDATLCHFLCRDLGPNFENEMQDTTTIYIHIRTGRVVHYLTLIYSLVTAYRGPLPLPLLGCPYEARMQTPVTPRRSPV